ncbi:hypothetical protein GJU39_14525 [Pedobacter petrophilus]|uniref:DUF3352 domain-containing protein n=1 Tax=Pedobacter petrophilus TaxID=1908241 RepID=A0A7K0G209_9SPHI|nr:hypothetical protein [Pedobacter petrophilus]MRX77299.1 hypothetical protein [Pedobacter petrophilus]
MRKIIILISVLLLGVALMSYLYFSKLGVENDTKDLALQSATNNAALLFSFRNDKGFYEIIEGQNLLQQAIGKEKTDLLRQLKEKFINHKTVNNLIQDQEIYLSLLPDSNKTLNFLITVQVKPDQTALNFQNKLKPFLTPVPKEKNIYLAKVDDSLNLFVGVQHQVLTLSTSLKLIKDAGVRLKENPFTAYIKEARLQNKNILAQLYINFNQVPPLLKNILSGNITGELAVFNAQNSFATLNYNFSREKILFNGNTELKAADNYLKLFENIPVQKTEIQNVLPDQTANYTLYAFDNYQSWHKKLMSWQAQKNLTDKTSSLIKRIKSDYRTDLNAIFPVYLKNQFVTFQLNTGEKLAAISLSNGEKVKQLLFDVSEDYNDEIKHFKSPDILFSYLGEPLKNFARPYYTIIDNYLITANNASTIQSFLSRYRNNKLLVQEPEYIDALNQLPSTSNIGYYINLKRSNNIFRSQMLSRYYKHLQENNGLKSFDTFYYQMSADQNKFITNMLLNKYLKQEVPDSSGNR